MHAKNRIIPTGLLLLSLLACTRQPGWKADAQTLMDKAQSILCELHALNAETDSLWDATVLVMDSLLPTDMNPVDRQGMLSIRNANLIRTYRIYKILDSDFHALIDDADLKDQALVEKIRDKKLEYDQNDSAVQAFLLNLETTLPKDDFDKIRLRFNEIRCDT
jgi:hypothetical protein